MPRRVWYVCAGCVLGDVHQGGRVPRRVWYAWCVYAVCVVGGWWGCMERMNTRDIARKWHQSHCTLVRLVKVVCTQPVWACRREDASSFQCTGVQKVPFNPLNPSFRPARVQRNEPRRSREPTLRNSYTSQSVQSCSADQKGNSAVPKRSAPKARKVGLGAGVRRGV